jgi:cellulose biosynthesis protein BcsQ
MNARTSTGQVITFYSFKGGTGRSMALANIAAYLARKSRVLVVDWDLDAPGLHYYLAAHTTRTGVTQEGLLEFFEECQAADASEGSLKQLPIQKFITETAISNLFLMKAGRFDSTYPNRARKFDWEALHQQFPDLIEQFARTLPKQYDYVLIDSRTGSSDISAICTAIMPEKLVVVFTPNSQNMEGAIGVVRTAIEYRKQSNDTRPLMIFPLPSRIEVSERKLLDEWRFSKPSVESPGMGYQPAFESLMKEAYDQDADLSAYFDQAQIQHAPQYSYGEQIAVLKERADRLSLATSYSDFAEILTTKDAPWEVSSKPRDIDQPSATGRQYVVDHQWFERQEQFARNGLAKLLNTNAFVEFSASLLTSRPNKDQSLLLDAARSSQIRVFGWPIGFVADRSEFSPRPTADGIVAEIPVAESMFGPSYDYWSLRKNGDFFLLQNYFEDTVGERGRINARYRAEGDKIFFDTRIMRLVESLLYCSRLYSRLDVSEKARILFAAKFTGLKTRQLKSSNPMRPFMARGTIEDEVRSEATASLDSITLDLFGVVKELLDPLFILFDYTKLSDVVYTQVINGFLQDVTKESPNKLRTGFTVDLEGLRLFAEEGGGKWLSKVYDLKQRVTVYETATKDADAAKTQAVSTALLNLYGPKHDKNPAEIATQLPWRQYTLPIP